MWHGLKLPVRFRTSDSASLLMWLLLGAAIAPGCASPKTSFVPDPRLVPSPLPTRFKDDDWSSVVQRHVKNGLVDYDGIARDPDALDRFVALISAMGPETAADQFPQTADKIAYYINAYNALVVFAVLESKIPETMYGLSRPDLTTQLTFQLDGKAVTLRSIETHLLQMSDGDVRILFTLSRAALGGPPLRYEPYHAASLDRQLTEQTVAALDSPYLLQIDHGRHSILVWLEILSHRDAFLAYWRQRRGAEPPSLYTVLLDMASPRRRTALNSAIGYEVSEMPFDRRLNRWTPTGAR
jgi:hypothetical protein